MTQFGKLFVIIFNKMYYNTIFALCAESFQQYVHRLSYLTVTAKHETIFSSLKLVFISSKCLWKLNLRNCGLSTIISWYTQVTLLRDTVPSVYLFWVITATLNPWNSLR